MTLLEFVLLGFGIGIITTAPVGPVNIMTIQHAMQRGALSGFLVGLGAVFADVIYAAVAVFGVSAVTDFVDSQSDVIRTIGGLVLILFGWKVWAAHPHLEMKNNGGRQSLKEVGRDSAVAFFLVLTNPGAVFGFIAIVGVLGDWRPDHGDHLGAAALVTGVGLGAASWWAGLSMLVSRYKSKMNDVWLERANRVAGLLLIVFGLAIYADLYFGLWQ